jgi:Bacteriophage baseplate protein W
MARIQPPHPDAPTFVDFPFQIDWNGRSAATDIAGHIRDLLEQILFTAPGERVNRPGFGSGIDRAVFRPNSELLAETTRLTAEAALQQWLGHLIELVALNLEADDNRLIVEVVFTPRDHTAQQVVTFERGI